MEKVRIRVRGWKKLGTGINIPDPQHCIVHGSRSGISKKVLNQDLDPGFWASWIRIRIYLPEILIRNRLLILQPSMQKQ
jgi:hypothetical protein